MATPRKVPQDHLKPAAQREAEAEAAESVEVEYQGHTYVLPPSLDDADGEVLGAMEAGHGYNCVKLLLDAKQFAAFRKTKPKVRDYDGLFRAYLEAIGMDTEELGE